MDRPGSTPLPAPGRRPLLLLLAAFILLGLAYSAINPLYEATDELRHYRFVRYIVANHALPVQGQEPCRSQSHHPPLFYVAGALLTAWVQSDHDLCATPPQNPFWAYRYWEVGADNKNQYLHGLDEAFPWHGDALAAHILRAFNVLIGAGVVWVTWAAGRLIWPRRPALALGAAAFVAFNPMFLYMAAAINNDVLAAFGGGLVLLACLRLWVESGGLSRRWGLWLGGAYALALMSKFNLAPTGLLIALTVSGVAWRKKQARLWWEVGALSLLTSALLAGWWFLRNQLLYGEPTGFREVTTLWGVRNPAESVGLALSELPYAWSTLWGRFGFGQIPLPQPVYQGLGWLVDGALAGLLLGLWRRRGAVPFWMGLLALDVLLFFAVLFNYMLVSPAGPMGRFFFPGLPALALLTFYGLAQLLDGALAWLRIRAGRRRAATGGLALAANLGLAAFSLVALLAYLAPAYARPPSYAAGDPLPNPVQAQFDFFARLQGYQVEPATVQPGQPLDIKLYWEVTGQPPGDYLLFVHLIDKETGAIVAQRDTHPGLGNFPASQWRPGERFVDSVRLYLPQTAYAPATATASIGLYVPDAYRLAITGPQGQPLGDALPLAQVSLMPAPGAFSNPQDDNFGNQVRLLGYGLERRLLRPGEAVALTLYWQMLAESGGEQRVEVRLLGEDGKVVAKSAGTPQADPILLSLPPETPPGLYRLDLAVIDPATGARQNIIAPDGHWIDDHLTLPAVRLQP